jgi:hypothetical protein
MTQWNYLRVEIRFGDLGTAACYVDGDPADIPVFEGALATRPERDRLFHDLGTRGWEMIGLVNTGRSIEYLFKRPRNLQNHS